MGMAYVVSKMNTLTADITLCHLRTSCPARFFRTQHLYHSRKKASLQAKYAKIRKEICYIADGNPVKDKFGFHFLQKPVIIGIYLCCLCAAKRRYDMKGSFLNTHMGNITIDKEVIAQYAGIVAMECFGIVGMGITVKDVVKLLKRDNLTKGITVTVNNNRLTLDFHVIVSYGVSILAVSDNLMDNVKYKVEEFTGMAIEKINIFVEGVRVID